MGNLDAIRKQPIIWWRYHRAVCGVHNCATCSDRPPDGGERITITEWLATRKDML
jgi:hypothetical protein